MVNGLFRAISVGVGVTALSFGRGSLVVQARILSGGYIAQRKRTTRTRTSKKGRPRISRRLALRFNNLAPGDLLTARAKDSMCIPRPNVAGDLCWAASD